MHIKSIVITLFLILTPFFTIKAQSANSLLITSNPVNPRPSEMVTLTLSGIPGLETSNIIWTANNRTIDSGIGKTTIEISAPNTGELGVINASVSSVNTQTSTSIILAPGSLDLIWESTDGYVPPFYKGKILPTQGSNIKFVAVPSSSTPNNLTYTWSKGTTILGSLSGLNKNIISIKNSDFSNSENISVSANNQSFSGAANASVLIQQPSLVLYEDIDGFINYNNAYIDEIYTNKTSMSFKLEPYFFSKINNSLNGLNFDIKHAGIDITNKLNPLSLSIDLSGTAGIFSIPINISHPNNIYQNISKVISLIKN